MSISRFRLRRESVSLSQTCGTTPARVRIDVDPFTFQSSKGTTTVKLGIQSAKGVGIPTSVRLQERGFRRAWETLPMGDVGAGVKVNVSPHARIRFEVRDYISPPPSKVIATAPGVTISGVLNDIQGLATIGYVW